MPAPDWLSTSDWDVLFLAGNRMPGVARVSITMKGGLDVKKPKKGKKAKVQDEGIHPARIEIELELQSDELEEFERAIPDLRPRSKDGSRNPIDISHPNARLWGVNAVMVDDIKSPHPETGGTLTIQISCIEWVAKVKKNGKQKDKPKGTEEDGWNVQPLIDALSPAQRKAAAAAIAGREANEANVF